jgi:hypothetical protein
MEQMQRYNEKEIWTNKVIYTYGKFEREQACSRRNKFAKNIEHVIKSL